MNGRPPKPTHLKILHGEKNKDRINVNEPAASADEPRCPAHVTGVAAEHWEFTCGVLRNMGVLSKTYATAIEQYCLQYAALRQLQEQIDILGNVLIESNKDEAGKPDGTVTVKTNPASKQRDACLAACERFWTQFGLTPVAKTRIQLNENKKQGIPTRKRA